MSGAEGGRGWRLYARITRLLLDEPSTLSEIVAATGVIRSHMSLLLRRMHTLDLVHVQTWRPTHAFPVPVWAFGAGEDAPKPPSAVLVDDTATLQPNTELIAYKGMLRELTRGQSTAAAIAEYCGTHPRRTAEFLQHMHELRLVRVADWDRADSGWLSPAYVLSPRGGSDAKRPVRSENTQRYREYRAKRKARQQQEALLCALAPNASIFRQAA